ncbi:MAG: MMPL family transporter [Ilumatobacteraceae bacterium]
MYRSLARWAFQHGLVVLIAWVVALVGVNALAGAVGAAFSGEFSTPESESSRGFDVVSEYFPGAGSAFGGSIVFTAEGGVDRADVTAAMNDMFAEVDAIEHVAVTNPYTPLGENQIAPGGEIAFASVNFEVNVDQTTASEIGAEIRELIPDIDGLTVEIGGAVLAEFEPPESELIGLAFAIVILVVSFGSVMAMGIPIGVALAGVGTGGFGLVSLMSNGVSIPEFAPLIGIMIGLGVGIDYALFMITRYRELTRAGATPLEATEGAVDTSGRAVVFAGITVVLSLLGMLLIGLEFVAGLGIAAAATVAVTLLASITLVPALLGLFHAKVEVTRWRGLLTGAFIAIALLGAGLSLGWLAAAGALLAVATLVASLAVRPLRAQVPVRKPKPLRATTSYRWSRAIQARPWTFALLGGGALVLLLIPVFSLRLGFSDEGNYSEETTTRRAYDLVAEGFGPGFNGPFIAVIETASADDMAMVQALPAALEADPGVARVGQPFPSDLANAAESPAWLIQVIPTTSPQDEATVDTVERLRAEVIPAVVGGSDAVVSLTGAVPSNIDFTDYLAGRILVFFGAVLGVSFLLLTMVFRSVLVPLKAVFMNVLSIASAYGVVVAVFQWGWLSSVFGVEPAPIEPFLPMMLFAIVFGLSMDYEVFLLSRVREEFDRTGDAVNSVADGLAATARVISAAAAIMVVVFGAFLLEDDRIVKMFGVGLAVAVLLDATLVRMLLVPATMALLGSRNWWIPTWLDRLLPHLNVEGPAHVASSSAAAEVVGADEPEDEPVGV